MPGVHISQNHFFKFACPVGKYLPELPPVHPARRHGELYVLLLPVQGYGQFRLSSVTAVFVPDQVSLCCRIGLRVTPGHKRAQQVCGKQDEQHALQCFFGYISGKSFTAYMQITRRSGKQAPGAHKEYAESGKNQNIRQILHMLPHKSVRLKTVLTIPVPILRF